MFKRSLFFRSLVLLIVVGIFSPCQKGMAERLYPVPTRDSVNKMLRIAAVSKPDTSLVKIYLGLAEFYKYNNDDSLVMYLEKALELSRKLKFIVGEVEALSSKALINMDASDTLIAPALMNQAIAICRENKLTALEGMVWAKMASYQTRRVKTPQRLIYFLTARDLFRQSGDQIREAYTLKSIADIHFNMGDPVTAIKELNEVLSIYKIAGYTNLHYTYDLLGAVYRYLGNYDEALKYAIEAINTARQTNDTADLNAFYLRFSDINYNLGQYDNAIAYDSLVMMRDETILQRNNITYKIYNYQVVGAVAETMVKAGRPREALDFYLKYTKDYRAYHGGMPAGVDGRHLGHFYAHLNQYGLAEKYYMEWLAAEKEKGRGINTAILLRLVNLYIKMAAFGKAKIHLTEVMKSAQSIPAQHLATMYELMARVDSAFGDYRSAYNHYQLHKKFSDSVSNERKMNLASSLQVKFETEQKDKSIQLLTSEKNEQAAVLKQRLLQRDVVIVSASILLLLVWFIYSRYRQKNLTARKLHEQQELINTKNRKLEELLLEKEELIAAKNELISEKEWLVKEVHHRVKNNLQMVMTLLYTQSSYLKDEKALESFLETQHRIHAISLIHQKLYQSDNLQVINMKGYIHELVVNLKESFDKENAVEMILDIDSVELDISKSIPIGLLLNEAVTNSFKYAFEKDARKQISISLLPGDERDYVLQIKDNGKGLDPGFDPHRAKTLGLKLIGGLCKQIKAKYSIESREGVSITVRFVNNQVLEKQTASV